MIRRKVLLIVTAGMLISIIVQRPRTAESVYFSTDNSQVKDFSLLRVGDVWHVISIHVPETPPPGQGSPGLAHATSYDLSHWVEQGIAIPTGTSGQWDDYDVWAPSIVKQNGTYYLFYAGVHKNGLQLEQRIGLATSTDLTNWTKHEAGPVFDCSSLNWTYIDPNDIWGVGMECRDPFVSWDAENNRWVMLYTARMEHVDQAPLTYVEHPAVVGRAYSTNLINWTDGGPVMATAGNKAESAHSFEHNGTWYMVWTNDCTFDGSTKCLQYATSTSQTGSYSQHQDIPEIYWANFASEYYRDNGEDYFAYDTSNALDFKRITWVNDQLSFGPIPAGTVLGAVFRDTNGNGILDNDEDGINGVTMKYYYDNGDDVFSTTTDQLYYSFPTLRTRRPVTLLNGTYRIGGTWPRVVWAEVQESNFLPGGKLEGLESTNGELFTRFDIQDTVTTEGRYFGFAPPDILPPSSVQDLSGDN